jgi:nucleoid DNA-binding protein
MAPRKKATTKTAKKTTKKAVKTTTTKKTTAKKAAPTTAVKAAWTKSELMTHLADRTGLSKKDVATVMEELGIVMQRHLKKGAAGQFTIPGLVKCVVKRKPATKARKGTNPFTGEAMTFKAKPARNVVKVRPLKRVKEMAE